MWLRPFWMRVARPMARGRQRRMCLLGALSTKAVSTKRRVEVDAGALRPGVRHGALDHLLEDGRARLLGELEELQRLAGLTAANEVDHDTGFARTEPREAGNRLADHGGRPFDAVVPTCSAGTPPREIPESAEKRAVTAALNRSRI